MLEILLMRGFMSKIGELMRAKNRAPLAFQILAAVLWIGCEITGLMIGLSKGMGNGAFLLGLVGAAVGAGTGYLIASSVKGAPTTEDVTRVFD